MNRCWLGVAALLLACGGQAQTGEAAAGSGSAASGGKGNNDAGGTGSDSGGSQGGCALTLGGEPPPLFDQTGDRFTLEGGVGWLSFQGALWSWPAVAWHQEAARSGSCRLLTYSASFCDPPCDSGQVCVREACATDPSPQYAGTLELRLDGTGIELGQNNVGRYSWSTTERGIDTVRSVRLSTTGSVGFPFDLTACIVGPPEPTGDWAALLAARGAGQDVELTWSNAVSTARVYLRMTTGIATHGGISPVEIECEGPDTGLLRLPGSYLDALYAQGWSCGECGDNRLIRYHATQAESESRVIQLRTEAYAQFFYIPRS